MSEESKDDKKDVKMDGEERITIMISDDHDNGMQFRIKPNVPLKKMFQHYADKQSVSRNDLRFYYNGQKLQDTDTAESVGIGDKDRIEVLKQQIGGQ